MAASSLFTLIDDIAALLDDIAVMSKIAAKKTAGVLGDDLALNAQQVAGVQPERELPVVWAVARGSMINKLILVPLALAISYLAPKAIIPMLMVGGAYLCFEGFEKLVHKFLHSKKDDSDHQQHLEALANPTIDVVALEKDKIKGAIRTDFILSAEIIVITLGTVAAVPFMKQLGVLSAISVIMTVGVYGLVAAIVKMDDAGLYLSRREGPQAALQRALGHLLLKAAPGLMKFLSIAGTIAMFLVGGDIITHNMAWSHHLIEHWAELSGTLPAVGMILPLLLPSLLKIIAGLISGAAVLLVWLAAQAAYRRVRHG